MLVTASETAACTARTRPDRADTVSDARAPDTDIEAPEPVTLAPASSRPPVSTIDDDGDACVVVFAAVTCFCG